MSVDIPGRLTALDRLVQTKTPLLLSLFAGSGGMDLGFERAGFIPSLAIDRDPVAVDTYNRNRPRRTGAAITMDLNATAPDAVLQEWASRVGSAAPIGLIGGPPCQPFSLSNVHRISDDPRAKMPLVYASILKAASERFGNLLRFFVLENVAGLLNAPHRPLLDEFESAFKDAGFALVPPFVLDAQDFGVPQRRRRLFLIGFKTTGQPRLSIPSGNPWQRRTVRDAIGGLVAPVPFTRGKAPTEFGLHPNHWHMNPKSPKFSNGANQPGHHLGRSFRMLNWDEPSQTVAFGHREVAVHPSGTRRLSVFEALLLQGFPSDYVLSGTLTDQIRLVSDALPPPLAEAVARAVVRALGSPAVSPADLQTRANGHDSHDGLAGVHTVLPKSTSA
jgi:DNA (cytosine-5)-methyltransferase 1